MGEMQGDLVRVSWDCIAQGVLAWHGWIPNSVKRRPSTREGRMVSARVALVVEKGMKGISDQSTKIHTVKGLSYLDQNA